MGLKVRLLAISGTCCAYVMERFAIAHALFNRKSYDASTDIGKLVAALVCFPAFEISNFFFKLAYASNQLRLRAICRDSVSLGGEDYSIEFDSLFLKRFGIVQFEHRVRDIARRFDRAKRASDRCHIH